ncbi:hypothetical protein RMATCC62417_17486 [Rhizopus microsporus]|nr:hypothetical protein RMATCC62417_17486 [Rhizopus microsporus]
MFSIRRAALKAAPLAARTSVRPFSVLGARLCSWDGFVRVWKLAGDNRSFDQIAQIPVDGVVNSIQVKSSLATKRTLLVVGVGQELKAGRWIRLKKNVKNCTKIFELDYSK